MLIKYRDDYEKITMGLLSFVPELKNIKRLKAEMNWYTSGEDRALYLWRSEDEHFTGVVCIETGEHYILVQRLSFTPAERTGRNIFALLSAISNLAPTKKMMGTLATQPLITNWGRTHYGK
ncbi:reductase [Paucilactobacillus sp. N302-9]